MANLKLKGKDLLKLGFPNNQSINVALEVMKRNYATKNLAYVKSVLEDIKGIGTVRRRALMKHFKDINLIKDADIDTLSQVESMDQKAAKAVYDFFHK